MDKKPKDGKILWGKLIIFIATFVILGIIFNFYKPINTSKKITTNDFVKAINEELVRDIKISENKITIIKKR